MIWLLVFGVFGLCCLIGWVLAIPLGRPTPFYPPDDPWLLEHGYRMKHKYGEGMEPGTVDHVQQLAAGKKREKRDAHLSGVRKAHTDPMVEEEAPRPTVISMGSRR